MPALDLIRPSVTAMRVIASVNDGFARELKLPPRIVRMHHQRYAHRFEATPGEFWPMRGGGRGHCIAVNVREINARLFENPAVA